MGVVVISKSPSVAVKPTEAATTPTSNINLSSYDKLCGALPMTTIYVFEQPIQEPVETIRRALSRALVHYYPVAGRLVAGPTAGEAVIRCTGEGVHFVEASADCTIKDVQLWDPLLKEELAVFVPRPDGFSYSGPLVAMQVTVFSCGGFVVGLTWIHALGDGKGIAQFMQAVSELARGLPTPSVVPLRSQDSLKLGLLPPFTASFFQVIRGLKLYPMVLHDITVASTLVNRIKDKYSSMNHGRRCTVFEAVAAVLWRCRTRATMPDLESLAVLAYSAQARKYAGTKEGYYGNCFTAEAVMATSGAVANADVMDLVKMIQGARNRVLQQSEMDQLGQLTGYNLLYITSWRNLGFEASDFGAGRPARVMGHWKEKTSIPVCTACIPCNDEHSVLSMSVREEHAAAFLKELAHIHDTLSV